MGLTADDIAESVILGTYIALAFGLLIIGAFLAIDLGRSLTLSLTRPYSMSFTGGLLSHYATHPEQLYQAADPIPRPTIYPPLFPWLVPDIPGVETIVAARLVSWTAIGTSTVLVGFLAYRYDSRADVATVAALLFLLAPTISGPAVILRVDHLALALTLAAVVIYTRGGPLVAVGALCVAAGFTKQPYAVVSIGAIAASLWLRGLRRGALGFASLTAAAGLVALGALNAVTDGQALVHLVYYNAAVPWYREVFLAQTFTFLVKHGLTIAIGIGALASLDRDEWSDPVAWLLVIGLVIGLATVGREGSWIGYFYPALAASTILIGRVVPRLGIGTERPTRENAAVVVVLLLIVVQLGVFTFIQTAPEKPIGAQQQVEAYLERADGAVLSEDPSVVPGPQRPVDVFMVMGLVEAGAVEGDPLVAALRCGRFEYVVTWITVDPQRHEYRRWTEAQQRAIDGHYEHVFGRGAYSVYRYTGSGCETPA